MTLTVYTQPLPFALLTPMYCPVREDVYTGTSLQDIRKFLAESRHVVALDIETRGTDPLHPDARIMGVGLASEKFRVYLEWSDDVADMLINVRPPAGYIAHNAYFDGSWLKHVLRVDLPWFADTYGLYRHLATEGFPGQRWGLKDAMTQLLLWPDANTAELDEWLRANGFVNKSGNPLYGEMWRAPSEILGKYCALDVEATYLLYRNILEPVMNKFPALREYHTGPFMSMLDVLITQKLHGILVDRPRLQAADTEISGEVAEAERFILTESELADPIRRWENSEYEAFLSTAPAKYLKQKPLGPEPQQFTKKGTVNKSWTAWCKRRDTPPTLSKNWIKWDEKRRAIESGEDDSCLFNLRSGDHLRWLFYEELGYTPTEFTEGGLPAIDVDTVNKFGEGGKALERLLLLHKEQSFTTKYLELTDTRSTVHPGFRVPGTYTGRLSGSEPNIQQVPKSRRFLESLIARPGMVWIDADASSLEPVVLAELSGDKTLMDIYGPNARPGCDVYLHTGAGISALSSRIIAEGYDPAGIITPELTAHVKKVCKQERSIAKVVHLAAGYGAGPGKIHKTLESQGISLPFEEVRLIHQQYWELYGGVKAFGRRLEDEWRTNRGWIYNGIGRPISVHVDYKKDIVNRNIQSTGHDILIMFLGILRRILDRENIYWRPIIWNWHDQTTIEVPEAEAAIAVDCFHRAEVELNRVLGGIIPIRFNPQIVRSLAEAKLE